MNKIILFFPYFNKLLFVLKEEICTSGIIVKVSSLMKVFPKRACMAVPSTGPKPATRTSANIAEYFKRPRVVTSSE